MSDDLMVGAAPTAAPTTRTGGTGTRRSRRIGLSWLGLVPFLAYVLVIFLTPIGFILYNAFRKTTTTTGARDPVTQQFVHSTKTTFTGANIAESLRGVYRTSLLTSIRLSVLVAVLGAVLGVVLAQAVVTSRSGALRQAVIAAAAVTANFGGIPLAFLFFATIGNAGVLTTFLSDHFGFSLSDDGHIQLSALSGIALVYLYFLIPLMVLVMTPALEGLKPAWAEAAQNLGASRRQYWRHVAAPVLLPNFLGSVLLLFCSSFSAYATASALNSSFPIVTNKIHDVLSGNVLPGQENLGAALALDMIVIVIPLTIVYQLLQRRTSRWLGRSSA